MKNRPLVLVAFASVLASLLLRLVPDAQFLGGLSLALQIAGIVILAVYIVGYFRDRSRSHR
ncbi:hypothetical protein [Curtobacterium aurantiacum]|uniref:Uncharacterized protein n=1 Tax=Curtobacterium aurantiacum TaxID=3236919 RepID=A0ABS5VFF5_9MICO|nr:hypothetical protein [Curtobacterium flaccumfaciens]MBT1546010.1 hypothetical protein [Curtobacterium flaccumfaciens pv. flaccumfaciens]MBT1588198.1 hypothetical protein [Curtobacterium flaccumfaciens pv. flaccumfaciens]MBT1679774.1 hypothetical protein [Curtobacterium flaccumfaciens pv. flaccumfaciens]